MPNLSHEFQEAVDAGLVSCRKHSIDDLWILNYTPECQFSKSWNRTTLQCRGLIVDANGNVVARPFGKFFNLSEHDNPELPKVPYGSPFTAYEKMDGSLGIIFHYNNKWQIATRGSFESEQAKEGQKILDSMDTSNMDKSLTYLVEIIY